MRGVAVDESSYADDISYAVFVCCRKVAKVNAMCAVDDGDAGILVRSIACAMRRNDLPDDVELDWWGIIRKSGYLFK